MTKHTLLQGDARVGLQIVPEASVHCSVTSPPYFHQRVYGAEGEIGQETAPAEYVADPLDRPVKIRTRGVGEVLYDQKIFTVAGSLRVTDPKRLVPYYKSGVPDGV